MSHLAIQKNNLTQVEGVHEFARGLGKLRKDGDREIHVIVHSSAYPEESMFYRGEYDEVGGNEVYYHTINSIETNRVHRIAKLVAFGALVVLAYQLYTGDIKTDVSIEGLKSLANRTFEWFKSGVPTSSIQQL